MNNRYNKLPATTKDKVASVLAALKGVYSLLDLPGQKEERQQLPQPPPHAALTVPHLSLSGHLDRYVTAHGTRILNVISKDTLKQLVYDLQRDEGWSATPYQCTAGVWTIGWGRTGNDVTELTPATTKDDEMSHFLADVDTAITDADHIFPNFRGLDPVRQGVLANMAFNLGRSRLSKFVNLRNAVEHENFEAAGMHMKNSLWYRQVGNRSKYLKERMETGRIAPRHLFKAE